MKDFIRYQTELDSLHHEFVTIMQHSFFTIKFLE